MTWAPLWWASNRPCRREWSFQTRVTLVGTGPSVSALRMDPVWTKSPDGHGITPLAITPAASEGSVAPGLANFKPGKSNGEQTAKPPKPTQGNRPGEPKVREVRETGANKEEEPLKAEVAQVSTSSSSSAGHPPENSGTPIMGHDSDTNVLSTTKWIRAQT